MIDDNTPQNSRRQKMALKGDMQFFIFSALNNYSNG